MTANIEKAMRVEAMLVRAHAAHELLRDREVDGIEALGMILIPTEGTLHASMQVAQETGPSKRALELAGKRRKPAATRASRPRAQTLDETLASL